jgi:hypothetical protein
MGINFKSILNPLKNIGGMISEPIGSMLGSTLISSFGGGKKGRNGPVPQPPSLNDIQDVFDEISGTKSIVTTGPDGKTRRTIARVPRSPAEQAIFDEATGLIQSSMAGLKELYSLSPALGNDYGQYASTIGGLKDSNAKLYGEIFKDMPDLDQFVTEVRSTQSRMHGEVSRRQAEIQGIFDREGGKGSKWQKRHHLGPEIDRGAQYHQALGSREQDIQRLSQIAQEVKSDPNAIFKHSAEIDSFVDRYRSTVAGLPEGPFGNKKGVAAPLNKDLSGIDRFVSSLAEFRDQARDKYNVDARRRALDAAQAEYQPYIDATERLAADRERDYATAMQDMPDTEKFTRDYEDFMRRNIADSYDRLGKSHASSLHTMGYGQGSSAHMQTQRALEEGRIRDEESARLHAQSVGQEQLGDYLQNVGRGYALRESARGSVAQGIAEAMRAKQMPLQQLEERHKTLHDLGSQHHYKNIGIQQTGAGQAAQLGLQNAAMASNDYRNRLLAHQYEQSLPDPRADRAANMSFLGGRIGGALGSEFGKWLDPLGTKKGSLGDADWLKKFNTRRW